MAATTLNISLPETMRKFVEEKISSEGYGTISEYVRELIRADQRREQARFDALISEALTSGQPSPLTKADVDEARKIVKARIAGRKGKR